MPSTERRSLASYLALNGLTNVGILSANFATGVLVARTLGRSGRGELAVLLTVVQILGWLASLGINEGVTYLAAKRTGDARRVVGTSLVLVPVLGTAGAVVAELVLPLVLAGHSPALLLTGRWFMLAIYLNMASSLLQAALAGTQDFGGLNVVQLVQPVVYVVGLAALAATGHLGVGAVLATAAVSTFVSAALALARLRRREGIGRPSAALTREAARYGLRVQGSLFGGLANARLDFLLLPQVSTAAAIGLYSVATNTSSILVAVIGSLGQVVLPAAARRGVKDGALLVTRMLRLTLFTGVAVAVPFALLAPWLLPLVYGQPFAAAATPLRILLPGVVLAMGVSIVQSGLQAANRPLAASAGQVLGLVVTLVGLLLTLRPFGIVGAAWTTTFAYAAAFALEVVLMSRDEHFSFRAAVSPRGLHADVRSLLSRLPRRRHEAHAR